MYCCTSAAKFVRMHSPTVDYIIDIRVKGLETGSRVPIAAVLLCRNNPCCNFYWRGWGQNTYFLTSGEKNSSC